MRDHTLSSENLPESVFAVVCVHGAEEKRNAVKISKGVYVGDDDDDACSTGRDFPYRALPLQYCQGQGSQPS